MGIIILAITATNKRPAKKKARPVHAYKRLHKKIVDSMINPIDRRKKGGVTPSPFITCQRHD